MKKKKNIKNILLGVRMDAQSHDRLLDVAMHSRMTPAAFARKAIMDAVRHLEVELMMKRIERHMRKEDVDRETAIDSYEFELYDIGVDRETAAAILDVREEERQAS